MRRHTRFDHPHSRTINTRLSVGTDFAVYTNVHHQTIIIMKGIGTAIVSTPKGVMTDKQARKENVGGEVLAFVW